MADLSFHIQSSACASPASPFTGHRATASACARASAPARLLRQGALSDGTRCPRLLSSCASFCAPLFPPSSAGHGERQQGRAGAGARAEVRTEQKVRVRLGAYKDGAISASVPAPKVASQDVDKALQEKQALTHSFERINFTGTGAALGHTVKINFEGTHVEGPQAGQPLRGTRAVGYELELREREDEPWRTFVHEITVAGMGQEESKTFEVKFPGDYKAPALAGVRARFTVTVKQIGVKEELPQDTRPQEEQRRDVEAQLCAAAERRANDALDAAIRTSLLASSEADVEKVAASVTWAKFGEKSLQDFKWNVLQEEVARVEGLPFDGVMPFLRSQAKVTYTE